MNMRHEHSVLDIGTETLVWQGRPAPRCFTFRHWKRSLFWLFMFFAAGLWQWAGWQLFLHNNQTLWWFMPMPFLLLGFCFSIGRCVRARLEWEHVYYVLSDKKLRIQCGIPRRIICLDLDKLSYARLELYDPAAQSGLGRVYVEFGKRVVALNCVEHAQDLFEILQDLLEQKQK